MFPFDPSSLPVLGTLFQPHKGFLKVTQYNGVLPAREFTLKETHPIYKDLQEFLVGRPIGYGYKFIGTLYRLLMYEVDVLCSLLGIFEAIDPVPMSWGKYFHNVLVYSG